VTHQIVKASPRHIRPLAKRMRSAACMTLQGFGFDPRRALHRVFVASGWARCALIDGRPVAMWGVAGPLLGESAYVWLVISDDVTGLSRRIVEEARRELAEIAEGYEELATTVLPTDDAALRFAVFLGFHDRHDEGTERLSRKAKCKQLKDDPRHRIPVGDQYVIGLGYHGAH
jgi:hypothetical protein